MAPYIYDGNLGRRVEITEFEELKLAARSLATESSELVERLESEFDESSDAGDINACLANKFAAIGREIERVKELRNDELRW
jgi:hypothetical protein